MGCSHRTRPNQKMFLFVFLIPLVAELDCSIPRRLSPCNIDRDAIDVFVITHSWSRESDLERATDKLLKSIAISTRCPVWFHLVCAAEECAILSKKLSLFGVQRLNRDVATHRITTTLHDVNLAEIDAKWKFYGNHRLHHSGLQGMVKFYFDELFPSLSRVLYFDTDMLVAGDIQEIYQHAFMHQTKKPWTFAHNNPGICGICGGLFAADLQHIRRLGGTHQLFLAVPAHRRRFGLGDQSMYQSMCYYQNASLFAKLSEEWNRSYCALRDNSSAIVPQFPCYKAAHFNCHFQLSEFDPKVLSIYAADTAFVESMPWGRIV